jgi:hypothetical protein
MKHDRKSGRMGRSNDRRATHVPTASGKRSTARKRQFRVETLKSATGKFFLFQAYADKDIADRVADQLRWVGATVRVVVA